MSKLNFQFEILFVNTSSVAETFRRLTIAQIE